LTCTWLTNTEVALVAEYYNPDIPGNPILPNMASQGGFNADKVYVRGPTSWISSPDSRPPLAKHDDDKARGNYLFMDAHVEYIERPDTRLQMFPKQPTGYGAGSPKGLACP
jgi:prepilin-type processing-associated H-X9-DG protein